MKDSAGNSLAENSIQRIRQLACTLVEDVAQKKGLSYPCEHGLGLVDMQLGASIATKLANPSQPTR